MKRNAYTFGQVLPFCLLLVAALWGFSGMFERVAKVFSEVHEDMSFGWYVPLFSLYALWGKRDEIRRAAAGPSLGGALASIPFVACALLGTRGLQMRFEQLGFIGLAVTLPWAFFGRRVARLCVFPAVYLLFTIPVSAFLDFFTIHLRLLASSTALGVLNGFGVDAIQRGTAIIATGAHAFQIDVAEPCSGLRSFFALTALTAAYAYLTQPTWRRRALLFLCAPPLAVLGNVMRVLTICLVAAYADREFATGFYHDYSGYIIFIVAISLMVAAGETITRLSYGAVRRAAPPDAAAATAAPAGAAAPAARAGVWCWLMCAAFAGVFAFQAATPVGMIMSAPEVVLPETLGNCTSEEVRYCQEEQCARMFPASALPSPAVTNCPACGGALDAVSSGEHRLLARDTQFRRRLYHGEGGVSYLVTAVIGGATRSSLHRPELCLPAQGFLMAHPVNLTVASRPFHIVEATPPMGAPQVLAYTFFNQAGVRTSRHHVRILRDVWDRSVHNRVDRWVMVTVSASAPATGLTHAREDDRRLLEEFLARLSEVLP